MVQPIGSARKLNPAPTPDWGLHILDTNLALGNLVALVDQQAAAFGAAPTALRVSPSTFKLTGREVKGRCVKQTAKHNNQPRCKRPIKLHIIYTLTAPAIVTFTLKRLSPGRKSKGRCVEPTAHNNKHKHCTRHKNVRGAITHTGNTGANTFTFNSNIGGQKLGPGCYQLIATTPGGSQRVKFRIAR
jgi:hypothetical protein